MTDHRKHLSTVFFIDLFYFAVFFFNLFFFYLFFLLIFDYSWSSTTHDHCLMACSRYLTQKYPLFADWKQFLSGQTNQWSWFELVLGRWSVFCNKTCFQSNLPKPGGVKWTISASDNDNDIVLLLWVNKQVCWIKTAAIRSWAATTEKKKKKTCTNWNWRGFPP